MKLLATKDGQEIWLHQIARPFVFEPPFPGRRYVAMVFANDESVTADERQQIALALFSSGCRYGLFAGHACRDWERALDTACIESAPDSHPPDAAFTATTAHEGESVEDVILFGMMNTSSGSHDFDHFLILFVGPRAGLRDEVETAIRSVWDDSYLDRAIRGL